MNRYKCPACGRSQYTSSDHAEVCIYCGNRELEKKERFDSYDEEESEVEQNG